MFEVKPTLPFGLRNRTSIPIVWQSDTIIEINLIELFPSSTFSNPPDIEEYTQEWWLDRILSHFFV